MQHQSTPNNTPPSNSNSVPSDQAGDTNLAENIQWTHASFLIVEGEIARHLQLHEFAEAVEIAEKLQRQCTRSGDEAYLEAPKDIAKSYLILGNVLKMYGSAQLALQPISESQRRYEILATWGSHEAKEMLVRTISAQGDCLRDLGRFKEAATAYEQAIHYASHNHNQHQLASNMVELAATYVQMGHYGDALVEYQESLAVIRKLNDVPMMASILHQMGIVYTEVDQLGQAETVFVEAWNLSEDYGDRARSADILTELGNLWNIQGGLEEALGFYQQAISVYVELEQMPQEGALRSNMADVLIKLGRLQDAQAQLERAIECERPLGNAAEPWKTWHIMARLQHEMENSSEEVESHRRAISSYLAYRQAGGSSQSAWAPVCMLVLDAIKRNEASKAEAVLDELLTREDLLAQDHLCISIMKKILQGERSIKLVDTPQLNYLDSAELTLLFDSLGISK